MVIRKERVELVSTNYNELMLEANKEISDKKDNGWYISFVQKYESFDGYAVILEAERRFEFDEDKICV